MNKTVRVKLVVCLVLVLSYLFLPRYGFTSFLLAQFPNINIAGHLLYFISHANVWHLLANMMCLWLLPCSLNLHIAIPISIICSFIPCFPLYDVLVEHYPVSAEPTMGFSGVLFAIVGISWGKTRRFCDMICRNKWFLLIPAFIPHINFLIHLYCLIGGYLYGSYFEWHSSDKIPPTSCDKR